MGDEISKVTLTRNRYIWKNGKGLILTRLGVCKFVVPLKYTEEMSSRQLSINDLEFRGNS